MTSASSFHRNCSRQRGFWRPQRPIGRALGDENREGGCQASIHAVFTAGFIWFGQFSVRMSVRIFFKPLPRKGVNHDLHRAAG
jgi:hypothetical protein